MLTITTAAAAAIERWRQTMQATPATTLRIYDLDGRWTFTFVPKACNGDEVVEASGATVLLGPKATEAFDHATLDASGDRLVLRRHH
jgi:Fe-S cluster assembly iron-binding protein IscA